MRNHEIIIPQVVYDELYAQANGHRQQGWAGLEALRRLFEAAAEAAITVTVHGNHATSEEIGLAADGRLDNIINDAAKRLRATLYTADRLQQLAAQASGVDAVLLRADITEEDLEFTKYFDSDTMSVHLKEGNAACRQARRSGLLYHGDPGGGAAWSGLPGADRLKDNRLCAEL